MPKSTKGTGDASLPPADGLDVAVPTRTLSDKKIAYDVLHYIPEESAEHYKLVPLAVVDGVLEVGMTDLDNLGGIDALNFMTRKSGMPFKVFRISEEDFERVLKMYRGLSGEVERALSDLETEQRNRPAVKEDELSSLDLDDTSLTKGEDGDRNNIQEDAPTIKIVSTILRYAIDGGASDVHIEPLPSSVRVRYRVDGELHTSTVLPISTHRALVARVKVLSSIRLDEQRKPQDGRFSASIDSREIDFRVSTFPSYYGEKVVIRIL